MDTTPYPDLTFARMRLRPHGSPVVGRPAETRDMEQPDGERPLHEIETPWSNVLRAHRGEDEGHAARAQLVLRYIGAVQRYMTRLLRDRDTAAELAQEFAIRVLR